MTWRFKNGAGKSPEKSPGAGCRAATAGPRLFNDGGDAAWMTGAGERAFLLTLLTCTLLWNEVVI